MKELETRVGCALFVQTADSLYSGDRLLTLADQTAVGAQRRIGSATFDGW